MSSSKSTTTPPTATKRACDACHRRKVRCNGASPCQNCVQASLACTFNKPPMKKGPKGSRAKVISELRNKQTEKQSASGTADGFTSAAGSGAAGAGAVDSPMGSPTFGRPKELLTHDLIENSISMFFDRIYPTLPILHRVWVQQRAQETHSSVESYCLLGSLCAFMVVQPGVKPPGPAPMSPSNSGTPSMQQQSISYAIRLVEDVRRRRSVIDFGDNPSTASIVTSFLLSATLFGLEKHTSAWYHLQEAILFARIMRIHDEKSYNEPETPIDIMNRRLFYILFVSERAQALQKHRDLTIHETVAFPEPAEDPLDVVAIPGLLCLYNLFSIVDDKVSEIWNNLRAQSEIVWPPNTKIWLSRLQKDLTEAMDSDMQLTEIQEVDLKSTQLWLRSIVWQLSTASGCLSSHAQDESMSFRYPIEIARELVDLTTRVNVASMEAHGIGFVEKLFDIAFTLIDVMTVVPIETGTFEVGPRDHLTHILYLVSHLRNGESRFVALLAAKIRESLPSLATSLQLPVAPTPPSNPALDRSVYQESSTGSGTSSAYGSPENTNHAMPVTAARFPPILVHSHSNPEGGNLGLNIASPVSPMATDPPEGASPPTDGPSPYAMPFGRHTGSGGGSGPSAGFAG